MVEVQCGLLVHWWDSYHQIKEWFGQPTEIISGQGRQRTYGRCVWEVFRDKREKKKAWILKESKRRKKYWKIEEVNFSLSFFDSTILDVSVKFWDFNMFSHMPQVELLHMLPTASLSLCLQTIPLQLTLSVWLLLPSSQTSHQYSWKNSLSSPCAQDHGNRASGRCWEMANPTFDFNSLPTCLAGREPCLWQFLGCSRNRLSPVLGFPGGSEVKASTCNATLPVCNPGRPGFDPSVGKIPWRWKWQPTPIFLPGESHGRRILVGYSPQGHKESDTTEQLHFNAGIPFYQSLCRALSSTFSLLLVPQIQGFIEEESRRKNCFWMWGIYNIFRYFILKFNKINNWRFDGEYVSDHSKVIWFIGERNHGCFSVIPGSFPNAFMSFISMDTHRDMRESGGSVLDFNLSGPMCLWPWVGLHYTYVG